MILVPILILTVVVLYIIIIRIDKQNEQLENKFHELQNENDRLVKELVETQKKLYEKRE